MSALAPAREGLPLQVPFLCSSALVVVRRRFGRWRLSAAQRGTPARPTWLVREIDHKGDAVEAKPGAEPVLEEVRVLAGEKLSVVDVYEKARRSRLDLRSVVDAKAAAPDRRRLTLGLNLRDEAVERGGRNALSRTIGERDRFHQKARDVPPGQRGSREHARVQP